MQVAPGKTTISAPLPIGPIGGAKVQANGHCGERRLWEQQGLAGLC